MPRMNKLAIVIIGCALMYPLWSMFAGSFLLDSKILMMPPAFFPKRPVLANYQWIAQIPRLGPWFVNTLIVVTVSTILSVTVSILSGYAFSLYKYPAIIWLVLLSPLMMPRISILIPLFVVIRKLHLSGTLWAVILPILFAPGSVYLARTYFETIPKSILESARIDGAGEATIIWHIVMPISAPIVAFLAVLAAIASYGDFIWQMLQLTRGHIQTLMVGLIFMITQYAASWSNNDPIGHSFAAGIVLLIPFLAIFIAGNKYMISTLGGAIKE